MSLKKIVPISEVINKHYFK